MAEKIVQTAGRDALGDFAPDFAHYNDDILFGENWNNGDIDLKTCCIVTVVALMAQGITDSSLAYHIQNAKCLRYVMSISIPRCADRRCTIRRWLVVRDADCGEPSLRASSQSPATNGWSGSSCPSPPACPPRARAAS